MLRLLRAVQLAKLELFKPSWTLLQRVPQEKILRHAPHVFVRATRRVGVSTELSWSEVGAEIVRVASPSNCALTIQALLAESLWEPARQILLELPLRKRGPVRFLLGPSTLSLVERGSLKALSGSTWKKEEAPSTKADGAVFGLLSYNNPDFPRASTNIGDWVQTLSVLRQLKRDLLVADDNVITKALGPFEKLQIDKDQRFNSKGAEVVSMDRDWTGVASEGPNIWTFTAGWFGHNVFLGTPSPLAHPRVKPIFVSFHLSSPRILTKSIWSRLKQCEPVGCRDLTTVELLRTTGIDAFFTGCVTLTLGRQFKENSLYRSPTFRSVDLAVDTPMKSAGRRDSSVLESLGNMSPGESLAWASRTLQNWFGFERVFTSRLHCYLPLFGMGHPGLNFLPRRPNDPRFAGLANLSPDGAGEIAYRLEDLMQSAVQAIADDPTSESFYEFWKERVSEFRKSEPEVQF